MSWRALWLSYQVNSEQHIREILTELRLRHGLVHEEAELIESQWVPKRRPIGEMPFIQSIKLIRARTGVGLSEAKGMADAYRDALKEKFNC